MTISGYSKLIREKLKAEYEQMYREPASDLLKRPFIVPGSAAYMSTLWDWDSWLTDIALRQIVAETGDPAASGKAMRYGRGCVLNFLDNCQAGWMPIFIDAGFKSIDGIKPSRIRDANIHKPVLAQHAAFLVKESGGDVEWLREGFQHMQYFHNFYRNHFKHRPTGLYFWADDFAIGVDNDPCTFCRPPKSSASIFLNCLLYKELLAGAYLAGKLGLNEVEEHYKKDAGSLKEAILTHCFDEWTGFYYSCDLNLLPHDASTTLYNEKCSSSGAWPLHSGQPRDWDCLIMRIGVWSGFLAMWAGIATPEQARRMVEEHYKNERTFNSPYGVRTLSKLERMYNVRASGNPSSWLGPIWGISNYMTFRGLVKYGFEAEARELAEKTVRLFGRDMERFGALHEYYQPDNGEPILNRGFQNWNYLVLNMIVYLEGKEPVAEF